MKVYVIRHGQTELNKKGVINYGEAPLSQEGVEQAKMAVSFLPKTIKHFYVSPLERTKQTAEILNSELNIPITFHDELKEVSFGILEGTPFLEEYKEKHKMQTYDWRAHKGESFDDVKTRVLKILKEIKKESKDEEALIVAHGGTIRLMHFLQFGEPLNKIENASIHSFDLDKILEEN